jgi:hypothetical protein
MTYPQITQITQIRIQTVSSSSLQENLRNLCNLRMFCLRRHANHRGQPYRRAITISSQPNPG